MYLDRHAASALFMAGCSLMAATAKASTIRLAGPNFAGQTVVQGAIFAQTPYVWSDAQNEQAFLTLGHAAQSQTWGFNTALATTPQTISATALQLSDVPTTTIDGVVYRQFLLDVSAPAHHRAVSLDALNISLGSSALVTDFSKTTPVYTSGAGKSATPLSINPNIAWQGGHAQVVIDIPSADFATASAQGNLPYVYLNAHFKHARGTVETFAVIPPVSSDATSPTQPNGAAPTGASGSDAGNNSDNASSNNQSSGSTHSAADSPAQDDTDVSSADPTHDPVPLTGNDGDDSDHCGCTCQHPGTPMTPEPGSALLMSVLGAGALLRRRRAL